MEVPTNLSQTRRSLLTSDDGSMDIDSVSAPATLIDDASSSHTLGMLGDGAVEWDDNDL